MALGTTKDAARGMGIALALVVVGLGQAQGETPARLVLTLEEGLRLALEQNESLLLSRADLRKSNQQVREARAGALPQLDLYVAYSRNWLLPTLVFDAPPPAGRQTVEFGSNNDLTGDLSLRQSLYSGGKVGAALATARLFAEYSGEAHRRVRQQLVEEVETRFYDLLLARELTKVGDLAVAQARSNLRQVQALRRAGRASHYDQLRAEVQVAALQADSIRTDNQRNLAEMALANVIGADLGRPIELVGDFRQETALPLEALDDLLALAMANRPELRQLDREIQMRERAVQIERATSRPSVDLVANGRLQFQSNKFDVVDEDWGKSWATGLTLSMPLFDGMRTDARVAQARVDVRRARLQQDQLERVVRLEIRRAWLDLRDARERLEAQRSAVEQSEQGLRIADSRYATGVGTQLETLDAQLVLVRAQTEHAMARRDRALALVRLERAVGTQRDVSRGAVDQGGTTPK